MIKINFILFSLLFIGSCDAQKGKAITTCVFSKNVNSYYNKLSCDSLKIFLLNSIDNCNLLLVDSITSNFLHKTDYKSYVMLKNLSRYSDGYLSEYVVEEIGKIYNRKFIDIFNYLYSDFKIKEKNNLEKFLIESWSSISSLSEKPNLELNKIRLKTVKDVKNSKGDSKSKLEYLNGLLKKINPKYLD